MILAYRLALPSNFYGRFKDETCGSEDFFKIAQFYAKTTSHGHRLRDVDDADLLKKVITGYGYDIETKA